MHTEKDFSRFQSMAEKSICLFCPRFIITFFFLSHVKMTGLYGVWIHNGYQWMAERLPLLESRETMRKAIN